RHPDGGPNSEKYCADRKESENNCMACSSQPGCGFCGTPREGEAHCQPGTSSAPPGTCREDWSFSTEDCATPPPPPPPPPAPPPPPVTPSPEEGSVSPDTE